MKARFFLLAANIPFLLAACGGGASNSTPPPPPPPQFTIGGSASGLAGTGLVLQDNGGDNLSVSASGSFTFKTSVTSGGAYSVTVFSPPNSANQIGTHGTLGTPNPGNIPGARWNPVTWIDAQGNLWFFGGHGYDSAGTLGQLNDLWRYEP